MEFARWIAHFGGAFLLPCIYVYRTTQSLCPFSRDTFEAPTRIKGSSNTWECVSCAFSPLQTDVF